MTVERITGEHRSSSGSTLASSVLELGASQPLVCEKLPFYRTSSGADVSVNTCLQNGAFHRKLWLLCTRMQEQ
jgi:hypothetical protein